MKVDLDDAAMQQLQAEQRKLLDTIDELRILGLSKFVDLPQLIVVGDQSAGKSSVLEAISRVRFPMKDGICTRFATELVLRQSPETRVDVKIQNESLDAFSRSDFSKDSLPAIIDEAKRRMCIGVDATSFSEDVLRVEISGPDVPQLTLVDLPGFYHNATENQPIEGVAIVNRLAQRYMSQENSIILAVVSAQSELAAQVVLGEARKCDPARERTLGIITKPDKAEEGSNSEQTYLRLAQNQESSHRLTLGWHVLRNRGQKEPDATDAQRDDEETRFFESGEWSIISRQDRGIESLREKLSRVLLSHIQRKLPGLIAKIDDHIKNHQARLSKLGDPRSSPAELRKYLANISSDFRSIAKEAVRGDYVSDFFGGLYPDPAATSYADRRIRKLRALVRDLNRAFYHVLSTKGARRRILWGDGTADAPQQEGASQYLQPLINLFAARDPTTISVSDLKKELDEMASENQGVEFPGSPSDRVTLQLFRHEAEPWEAISVRHVDLVVEFAKLFVERLISHVTGPDTRTADALLRQHVNPYFDRKKTLLRSKVAELIRHYKIGYDPQPLRIDLPFRGEMRKNERIIEQVVDIAKQRQQVSGVEAQVRDVVKSISNPQTEFSTERIIDNMLEYYEVSILEAGNPSAR